MEQQPQPVIGEVAKAVADPAHVPNSGENISQDIVALFAETILKA
jgi:hypothetical protein